MFSFRLRILPVLLLIILLFLQYQLWFKEDGVVGMLKLKKEANTLAKQNEQLQKRNQLLLQKVKKLQTSKETVEAHARDELGMVKQEETFYQVVQ